MQTSNLSLDPETLAKLEGLELRARYIVDGYLSGMHRSAYRGQSVEFTEVHRQSPQRIHAEKSDGRYTVFCDLPSGRAPSC